MSSLYRDSRNGLTIMTFWHCKLTTSFRHGQTLADKNILRLFDGGYESQL